jgi:hypothetical protein
MTKAFTEQILRTSYRDDYRDSDGYYRVLFNSGRALQARELTQLQTIIQKELSRLGSNLFKDGAPIQPPQPNINNGYEFVKISATTAFPSNLTTLNNVVFTGQTSGLKVKVYEAVAATSSDPQTLYIQYLDIPSGSAGTFIPRLEPGETISGTVSGSTLNLTVQTTNTTTNPAVGVGFLFSVGEGSFFTQGHFVFCPAQSLIVSKYTNNPNATVGFKVVQDVVTSSDDEDLFDNQGAVPNRSSPGADRYRIRLILTKKIDLAAGETFVYFADLVDGVIKGQQTSSSGFNSIREEMALRTREESGNYIKKYFKAYLEPNDASSFLLKVDPGTAYVNGYRINKSQTTKIVVPRAQDTFTQDNESIPVDYGNYFEWDSGKGMLDFNNCQQVSLKSGLANSGSEIGTARVRAIKEGVSGKYNVYLFDISRTSDVFSLRDVKSIAADSDTYVHTVLDASGNSILKEPNKRALIFDTPIRRPKSFTSISLTGARKFSDTTSGAGEVTISLSAANENFTNTGDWIIASADSAVMSGYTITPNGDQTSATITGLDVSTPVEIMTYVRKGTAKIRQKTLNETTLTATLDSDGNGFKYIDLNHSDIYEVLRIRKYDSDGESLSSRFSLDPGQRDTHYDDGRLILNGGSLDSDGMNVFVRFKYFSHGTGDFFAVNSYNTQVQYIDIPAHRLSDGRFVSLRDVLDFRPSTNGSGSFTVINELPQPTDLVEADAEYYLPRLDKLVLSATGDLRYITGTSSLQPRFPSTPANCIDLYKFELNPNTLHTKDLKSRMLPLKGYTMEDIGKIEKKLEKLEELTTLSLLELATQNLKVLDSAGADRTKSGFIVDNFSTQVFSDTKNPEYRASIDPRQRLLRPSFKETSIDLVWDSSNTDQLRVVKYGDMVMLDHTEVLHTAQDLASKTENVNPFYIDKIIGNITLSPASDYWKESEVAPPRVIDGGTQLDTRQAFLWNNWEWNWQGVDVNDLQVGDISSNVTGVNTTVTKNTSEPRLVGSNVTEEVGDWAVTGSTTSTTEIGTNSDLINVETEEFVTRRGYDPNVVGDGQRDGYGAGDWEPQYQEFTNVRTTETYQSKTEFENIKTTTLEQTTTINTENNYAQDTEIVTNTSTTTTVNRIASESTVREIVDNRVIDVAMIPWMRSRTVSFRAEGLRPNSRYFPFFDGTDVGVYCRQKSFVRVSDRGYSVALPKVGVEHSEGSTSLVSNSNGVIEGEFEIPCNNFMKFRTGFREFALYDVSVYDKTAAMSTAETTYVAQGTLETRQDTILSTRILEIVGSQTTVDTVDREVDTTLSTETIITTEVASDVKTEKTYTEVLGDITTNSSTRTTGSSIVTGTGQTSRTNTMGDTFYEPTPDPTPDTSVRPAINTTIPAPVLLNYPTGLSIQGGYEINIPVKDTPTGQSTIIGSRRGGGERWSNGARLYIDPMAQSFEVPDPNGIFITRIRVYFSAKDSGNLPVKLELRPMVNGIPDSNKVIPNSRVVKPASAVNIVPSATIASMLANGTDFVFEEPVYLKGRTEYAVVLWSPSMEYRVYTSEVEDFVLGSTEQRISKQPYLGSLFKSQNSKTWEPSGREDLAFRIYRAQFEYSGNAILENADVPQANLGRDPLVANSGSNVITVVNRGHGLRATDKTVITGLDSATRYNGILGSSIMGEKAVIAVDGTGYKFLADSAATSTGRFGGGRVTGSQNLTFDVLRPMIDVLVPETTNVTFSGKFTTNSSLVDSDQGRFTKDTSFRLIKNKANTEFVRPMAIFHPLEEDTEITNGRSAEIQCSLTTTDPRVSPIIDLQRAGLALIGNMIDKQDSSATSGFNVPMNFIPETNPQNGSSLAKHITVPANLAEEAVGLKILFAANRPPGSDFQVYYRTADAGEAIRRKNWVLAETETTNPTDTNKNIFREYRYLVGGFGGQLDPFSQFQVKIVFRSTNSAKVPTIRDLRAIALAV